MTTTDTGWIPQPPPAPGPGAPRRLLRRSHDDRVGAGVAGGLGEYFGLDPVLFRVLFAVSAFFGGAGILAYVVAWAAIPEDGTVNAPVDRFIAGLRRRRVPIWIVAVVAGILLWALAFSWWAPGPFFPVMIVVILLVTVFGHRTWSSSREGEPAPEPVPTHTAPAATAPRTQSPAGGVNLRKESATGDGSTRSADAGTPDWVGATRAWLDEAKQASRERRRRAFPVRIAILVSLAATLTALGIADGVSGIRLPVYFWATAGIVAVGILVGVIMRRAPWSMTPLLVLAITGMIAFGNSQASLHDGVGKSAWAPGTASELKSDYRLAFGQANLDLRELAPLDAPRRINLTVAAGQVKVLLPETLNATVRANVRIGEIDVDGKVVANTHGGSIHRVSGYDIAHTIRPPAGAQGASITITVHLADGNITVEHS